MARTLTVPDQHALKIARDTMRMNCVMARIMGQTHPEAARVIFRLTGTGSSAAREMANCTCPGAMALRNGGF